MVRLPRGRVRDVGVVYLELMEEPGLWGYYLNGFSLRRNLDCRRTLVVTPFLLPVFSVVSLSSAPSQVAQKQAQLARSTTAWTRTASVP